MIGLSYGRSAMPSDATLKNYASELLKHYLDGYQTKYKTTPVINRYKLGWGFRDLAADMGVARGKQIIDFYFELNRAPHLPEPLLYGYDKLWNQKVEEEEDKARREQIRKETLQRTKDWVKNVNGVKGS